MTPHPPSRPGALPARHTDSRGGAAVNPGADPVTNPAHAARAIRANETLEALDAYERAAKERGITTHEVTLIAERRRELARAAR